MDLIKYLQIPYQHQGRTYEGVDCFGIVRLFYEAELHILLPDYGGDYDQEWWKSENLFLDMYKTYKFKRVKAPTTIGDLIMFKNTTTTPGHLGIVVDDCNFLHMTREGAGVNNFRYGVWARQVHSYYSLTKAGQRAYRTR